MLSLIQPFNSVINLRWPFRASQQFTFHINHKFVFENHYFQQKTNFHFGKRSFSSKYCNFHFAITWFSTIDFRFLPWWWWWCRGTCRFCQKSIVSKPSTGPPGMKRLWYTWSAPACVISGPPARKSSRYEPRRVQTSACLIQPCTTCLITGAIFRFLLKIELNKIIFLKKCPSLIYWKATTI